MTQANVSRGAIAAADLIKQLHAGKLPSYVVELGDGPDLSQSPVLSTLRTALANPQQPVVDLLMAAIRPVLTFRGKLDLRSSATDAVRVFRGMVSGDGDRVFDLPGGVAPVMEALFKKIKQEQDKRVTNRQLEIRFSERDLFHGHVVAHESEPDVVVLFHAKEYPDGEFPDYRRAQLQKLGLYTDTRTFGNVASMSERNYLWSLRTNKLYLLTDPNRTGPKANPDFAALITQAGRGVSVLTAGTVSESFFGTELFAANYFPNHLNTGSLFFTPKGPWAILKHLEVTYPEIDPVEIKRIYAETGESLETTRERLEQLRQQRAKQQPANQ